MARDLLFRETEKASNPTTAQAEAEHEDYVLGHTR